MPFMLAIVLMTDFCVLLSAVVFSVSLELNSRRKASPSMCDSTLAVLDRFLYILRAIINIDPSISGSG